MRSIFSNEKRKQVPNRELYLPSAYSLGLGALLAFWISRLALDFLLSAGQACLCKSFSRFARLRDAPRGVHGFAVNYSPAIGAVLVDIARAFAWYIALSHTT
jgi:hypothetical protein